MTFRAGVEVGLQRAYAVLLVLFGAGWATIVLDALSGSGPLGGAPLSTAAGVAFVATAAVSTVRGIRTRLGPVDAATVVLVAAAVQIAFLAETPAGLVVGYRTQPVVAALIPLLTLTTVRFRVPGATALVLLQFATSIPADGWFPALLGVWPTIVAAMLAGVLAPTLRTAGARADAAAAAERDARIAADTAAAEREAAAEFARILHDDVSSALRGISSPGVPEAQRRAAAAGAVAALDGAATAPSPGGETDLRPVLDELDDGTTPRRTVLPAHPVVVPAEVAEAVRGAAREALRNVDRHAHAGEVRVELTGGPAPRVTISDDGVGFDPPAVHGSTGIDGSIVGRMRAVGGAATIHGAPGGGTTVRLALPDARPEPPADPAPAGRIALFAAATGDVRRPLYAVLAGYLGLVGLVAVVQPGQLPESRWFLLWYAAVCALAAALVVRARTGIGGARSAVTVLVAVGGAVASVAVVPVGDLLTFASWPVGAVTPLLMVLVIVRPSREALLAVLAEQAGIVAVLALGPMAGAPLGRVVLFTLPLLVAPALGTLMAWLIGRTILRLGRATIEANHRRARVDAESAAEQVRRAVHDRRTEALHREVRPFLAAVASGSGDDAARRETALRLGTAIRDELHLPGVLDRELRDAVDDARAAGCRVVLQPSAGMRFAADRVAALLRSALAGEPAEEIVLGLHAGGDTTTASLVVIPGRAAVVPDTADVTVQESTPDYTWVEVVVSGIAPRTRVPASAAAAEPDRHSP